MAVTTPYITRHMSQKPGFGKVTALIALAASWRRVSTVAATNASSRCAGWMLAEPIKDCSRRSEQCRHHECR